MYANGHVTVIFTQEMTHAYRDVNLKPLLVLTSLKARIISHAKMTATSWLSAYIVSTLSEEETDVLQITTRRF